jgi:CBS domain-containing protein
VAVGAGLAVAAAAIAGTGSPSVEGVVFVLAVLAVLNLVLGIVNLIPAYPLDGGRIVHAIAWRRARDERAGWVAAATSGRLTGIGASGAGFVVMLQGDVPSGALVALSGWFLTLSARSITERVRFEDLVKGLSVEDVMEKDPPTIDPRITVDSVGSQLVDPESAITAVPVVHDGALVGLLGTAQVRAVPESRWPETHVEAAMVGRERLVPMAPTTGLLEAVTALHRAGLDGLPVLDRERLVGVFTRRSLGLALQARSGARPAEGGGDAR